MAAGATVIQLCGRLVVQVDGERLEDRLRGRQGRLLLAYLVLNRDRPVRRDELLEALWFDGGTPPGGDAVLAPPLSRLRSALGPGRLAGRGEIALVLPDGAQIDWEVAHAAVDEARASVQRGSWVAARDAAVRAVEIADRGLLPGLEAPWIDDRRSLLGDLRLEGLELLATAGTQLRGADLPAAERAARAAVEAAPFRESARAALMEALRAQGNVAEALRAYEEARQLLREELGTTPGPALVALHERLLREEPAAVGAPGPAGQASDLVGRDRERAQLADLVRAAVRGEGRVTLVEGPAGIGKSRLLAEGRRLAADAGARVLTARASHLERGFPWGVARQLFEGLLAEPGARDRALAGAADPARAVFEAPHDDSHGDASFAALNGLYWLTLNVAAEQPVVVIVDDLHWCDVPSLRFVAYLARRLEGQPVLLAIAQRTGEPPADAALLAEIMQDPDLAILRPAPLDTGAVDSLVRSRLGDEADAAFSTACHRTTGGNPLLLRQLLSALETDHIRPDAAHAATVRAIGSRAIAATVELRLSRLSSDARAVARAIAVLGEDAALPAIAALAGIEEARVAAATAELARAEILRPGARLGFVHPLVLDAVYERILPGERDLAHAQAARILHDAGAAPERVASHLLLTPPRREGWVVDLLRHAAAGALRTGGSDSAIAYLRRALEEPPRPDAVVATTLELGMAESLTNAAAAAERLGGIFDRLEDPMVRIEVGHVLGRALMFSGDAAGGKALARRVAATLPAGMDDDWRALEAFALLCNCFEVPDQADFHKAATYRSRPLPPGPGSGHLAAAAALEWAYTGGRAEECVALARDALRQGHLIETDNGLLSIAAVLVLDMADLHEVMAIWDQAMAVGHARGSLFSVSSVHLWRGFSLLRRGDLDDAEESLRLAQDEIRLYSYGSEAMQYAGGFLAAVHVAQGDMDAARRALAWSGQVGHTSIGARYWRLARLHMLAVEQRDAEALLEAEDIERRHGWVENPADGSWVAPKAQALARLGRLDEALEILEEELRRAWRWGAPGTTGPILRVIGQLRGEEGLDDLEEAAALLERSPRRLERAWAQAALGEGLLRAGREEAARDALHRAYALATVCSAKALTERIVAQLRTAGGEPRPATGADALTNTERRAAELAAEGRDDREVAQAMFLTPHAVQVRLDAAQRKLGIADRAQLAGALAH